MRKLQTHDVFMAMKVIGAAGIREEVEKITKLMQSGNTDAQHVGFTFLIGCMEKLSGTEAENSVYEMLAGPLELKPKQIKEMDPIELINLLKEMKDYVSLEEWKSFFKSVSTFLMQSSRS